jgi:asparagine synthase (glutamine-hydrolysing)
MDSYIARRGPDGSGSWLGPAVGFGHRRLSILDLGDRAAQPMRDPASGCVLTYNGEIYNFREQRAMLQSYGADFRTSSDTEVLLQAYRIWGLETLLERLDGMFAFALFDPRADSLILCRDRFGKKPLYYLESAEGVLFSSDVRSIWAVTPGLSLDAESLDYYLTELSVPQPRSIWREVRQLEPAEAMIWRRGRGPRRFTYWTRVFGPKRELPIDQTIDDIDQHLRAAVSKRTVSDVPVGAFLSGGIDSGLVVAHLAKLSERPVQTYSVSVDVPHMDEAPLARVTALRYRTQHSELRVELQPEDTLRDVVEVLGEPFGDSSILPSFLVAAEMRKHVKVVLSGDGGDELFGYPEYSLAYRAELHAAKHPSWAGRTLARVTDRVKRFLGQDGQFVGLLQHYASLTGARRLFRTMGFSWDDKLLLYADSAAPAGFARDWLEGIWQASRQQSLVDTLVEAGLRSRLLNDYLVKVDRASMAHGLEVRSPFLDRLLAERSFLIPNAQKFAGSQGKHLLRCLAMRHLDDRVATAPKRGFAVPLGRWMRDRLGDWTMDLASSRIIREQGLFKTNVVQTLVREHQSEKRDHSHRLFALLMFWLWTERFARRPSA